MAPAFSADFVPLTQSPRQAWTQLLLFGPNCGKDGWVAEIGVTVRQFAAELFVEHFDLPPLRIKHRSVMIFAVLIMRSVRKTWRAAGIWVTAVDGPAVVKAALPAL